MMDVTIFHLLVLLICLVQINPAFTATCYTCAETAPQSSVVVSCTVEMLDESTIVVACEDNSSQCTNITNPNFDSCIYFLNNDNDRWKYSPYFFNEQNEMIPDLCPKVVFEFPGKFACACSDNNCNRLSNITVSLTGTTSPSSTSEVYLTSPTLLLTSNFVSSNTSPSSTSAISSNLHSTFVSANPTTQISITPSLSASTYYTSNSSNIQTIVQISSTTLSSVTFVVSQISNNTTVPELQQNDQQVFIGIIVVLLLAVAMIFTALLLTVCISLYRKHVAKRSQHSIHHIHTPPPMYDADFDEGSFPITILHTIGYGKFGSVFKAMYDGVPIAVKVFGSHHLGSWNNEKHIYMLESTPHENILHFIGCEHRGNGSRRQLYMMTEYHALGSLSRFLQHNKLSWDQTLRIIHSVSCGLSHLHSNSYIDSEGSVKEKLSIAHRDVKSANVLVKDVSGHCILGDLGLGLILDPNVDDRQMANSGQVGTYRYMAPEALDARVNLRDIESFKQIDVYALALVLWEACTRCELSDNLVPPYQPPYSNLVGERPTLELMKHVVVVEKSRPHLMGYWESHPGLKEVINILEESWDEDPEARLTAANIVSRLESLERTQRKEELGNEEELSSHNGSHSSVITEQRTHNHKVRVSSSFSGQPHNQPIIQRVRLSVGNQRYPRRNSMTHHSDLRESSFVTDAESHRTTRFSNCEIPVSLNDSQLIEQETIINNDNETQVNIDAATGQPNALSQSSYVSLISLDSIVDNEL